MTTFFKTFLRLTPINLEHITQQEKAITYIQFKKQRC